MKSADAEGEVGANQGYQALGELIGGILGGLGLGWLLDQWPSTSLRLTSQAALLGMVLRSIWSSNRAKARINVRQERRVRGRPEWKVRLAEDDGLLTYKE